MNSWYLDLQYGNERSMNSSCAYSVGHAYSCRALFVRVCQSGSAGAHAIARDSSCSYVRRRSRREAKTVVKGQGSISTNSAATQTVIEPSQGVPRGPEGSIKLT